MIEERRKYPRFESALDVDIRQAREGAPYFSGTAVNFSRSGMCLSVKSPALAFQGAVDLKVQMPGRDVRVTAVGDVQWLEQGEDQSLLGIKLVAMDKKAKFDILDHCEMLTVNSSRDDVSNT